MMTILLIHLTSIAVVTAAMCKSVMQNKKSKQKLRLRAYNINHNHNNIDRVLENDDEINNCNMKDKNSYCNSFNGNVYDYHKLMLKKIMILTGLNKLFRAFFKKIVNMTWLNLILFVNKINNK